MIVEPGSTGLLCAYRSDLDDLVQDVTIEMQDATLFVSDRGCRFVDRGPQLK